MKQQHHRKAKMNQQHQPKMKMNHVQGPKMNNVLQMKLHHHHVRDVHFEKVGLTGST